MLFLRTLGSFNLMGKDGDGDAVEALLAQPKRFALFVYLALARNGDLHSRDTLLALFWPEQDEDRARNALGQSLHFLRCNLPEGILVGPGKNRIGIDPRTVRSDVGEFDLAVSEGRWKDALDLYGGSFLEGFHIGGAQGFEEWMAGERERLREAAAGAAWSLARQHIEAGSLVEAERTAQRAMDLVCTDESPVRGFIEALARAGDRAAALNFYQRFSQKLEEKLDLDPAPETQGVAENIRNGTLLPEPVPSQAKSGGHGEVTGPPPEPGSSHSNDGDLPETPGRKGDFGPLRKSPGSRMTLVAAATGTMVLLAIMVLWRPWLRTGGDTDRPDPALTILAEAEGSAPQGIREVVSRLVVDALVQQTHLRPLPNSQISLGLETALRPDTARISQPMASELAIRAGISTIVVPEVDAVGRGYRVAARVMTVENDSVIARGNLLVRDEDELMRVPDDLGRQLAEGLEVAGALTGSRWWRGRPVARAVTHSVDAYQSLLLANEANSQTRYREAVVLTREALALDTGFATAWAHLTRFYANQHLYDSARFSFRQASLRSERVRPEPLLAAEATVAMANGDLARHLELREQFLLRFGGGYNNYAMALALVGRHEEAVEVQLEGFETLPFGPTAGMVENLLYWLNVLGRFDEARRWANSLSGDMQRRWRFFVSLAAADWEEAEKYRRDFEAVYPPRLRSASLYAARGRVREAMVVLERLAETRFREGSWARAETDLESALTLAVAGDLPLSWDRSMVRADPTERARRLEVIWAALGGDAATAARLAASIPPPIDPALERLTETELQSLLAYARLAAAEGRWRDIERQLSPTLGVPVWDTPQPDPMTRRLTLWTLAEAYERLERPDSASQVWEMLTQGKGSGGAETILRGFTNSFAHRRAALAFARAGELTQAKSHWQAFLRDFTNPDPEYRWMVEEARIELSRLDQVPAGNHP